MLTGAKQNPLVGPQLHTLHGSSHLLSSLYIHGNKPRVTSGKLGISATTMVVEGIPKTTRRYHLEDIIIIRVDECPTLDMGTMTQMLHQRIDNSLRTIQEDQAAIHNTLQQQQQWHDTAGPVLAEIQQNQQQKNATHGCSVPAFQHPPSILNHHNNI